MEIKSTVMAGTLESSDIQITLAPTNNGGIVIELESEVKKRYGKQICKVITETLKKFGVENVKVKAIDKGALDCVIKARTITAIQRGMAAPEELDWGLF